MAQYAIITDLNRCNGCLACSAACKLVNNVPVGNFWIKTLRIGPNPINEGDVHPDVEMYFLPVTCQHCENPECVKVCPTGASFKADNGTVQVDKSKCIGCQFCAMACPYGVRYLNEEERVVEKCTMCQQQIAQGDLPQCVAQCGARARWFGDLEQGLDSFVGPYHPGDVAASYDESRNMRVKMLDYVNEFSEDKLHALPDVGNGPAYRYILRKQKWQGEE